MWHHRQQQTDGKSFAELSAASNPSPKRVPSLSEIRSMPAAGKKSNAPVIGAVKFVMEVRNLLEICGVGLIPQACCCGIVIGSCFQLVVAFNVAVLC